MTSKDSSTASSSPIQKKRKLDASNDIPTHQGKYMCDVCSDASTGNYKLFVKKAKWERHMRTHTDERPFPCPHPGCDKSYRRKEHLAVHCLTHAEKEIDRKPFVCSFQEEGSTVCNARFATRYHLNRHVTLVHQALKPYECDECSASFSKPMALQRHKCEIHLGCQPYPCPQCDKSFSTAQKLSNHIMTHSAKYVCGHQDCSFMAAKWTELQSHIKTAHPPTCPNCGKIFTRREGLKNHLKTVCHDGLPVKQVEQDSQEEEYSETDFIRQRYQCPMDGCSLSFLKRSSLNQHLSAVHHQSRPFVCSEPGCHATFAYKHVLERHVQVVHSLPLFESHTASTPESGLITLPITPELPETPVIPRDEDSIAFLTGYSYELYSDETGRDIACPVMPLQCPYRFKRQYDAMRHATSVHGNTLKTISSFPTTRSVKVTTRQPATPSTIKTWESLHSPLKLPTDLIKFYSLCDGLTCRWKVTPSEIDCGIIQVNSVNELIRFDHGLHDPTLKESQSDVNTVYYFPPGPSFILSACHPQGKLLLVYPKPSHKQPDSSNSPQVWFYTSESRTYHPIAPDFSSFFRLMLAHLGIIGWPRAYSMYIATEQSETKKYRVKGGLEPNTLDWLQFYAPDRVQLYHQQKAKLVKLCIDFNRLSTEFYNQHDHQAYDKLLKEISEKRDSMIPHWTKSKIETKNNKKSYETQDAYSVNMDKVKSIVTSMKNGTFVSASKKVEQQVAVVELATTSNCPRPQTRPNSARPGSSLSRKAAEHAAAWR